MVSSFSTHSQEDGAYQTGFIRWRAAENGFHGWTLNGVKMNADGELEFDPGTAMAGSDPFETGTYRGRNYYNGGTFHVGEAISPEVTAGFRYKNAIASWNASTPRCSWIEVQFRAKYAERWSRWFVLGIWAADPLIIARHSVQEQKDADGAVADDTFINVREDLPTDKFQLKLRLFSIDGAARPCVRNASVAYSTAVPKCTNSSAGNPSLWGRCIDVPQYSQLLYPDGGSVWCSPTSTSMVLSFLENYRGEPAPHVHKAVNGVYDWVSDAHGNWPFNTAFASTFGYEAYVARFTSLAKAEEFIAAGVPVIMSIAWKKGDLTNADVDQTDGHLVVLVGFDAQGDLIVNDPASPTNETVRRTYLRSQFEPLWLKASGGTVYLIHPQGASVPSIP